MRFWCDWKKCNYYSSLIKESEWGSCTRKLWKKNVHSHVDFTRIFRLKAPATPYILFRQIAFSQRLSNSIQMCLCVRVNVYFEISKNKNGRAKHFFFVSPKLMAKSNKLDLYAHEMHEVEQQHIRRKKNMGERNSIRKKIMFHLSICTTSKMCQRKIKFVFSNNGNGSRKKNEGGTTWEMY